MMVLVPFMILPTVMVLDVCKMKFTATICDNLVEEAASGGSAGKSFREREIRKDFLHRRWDYGGGALDRAKGNKRNWILVWEDGFCDFYECERAGNVKGRFGADVFFKMSHENGRIGKVAADNSHKWVFKDNSSENDSSFITSWNVSIEPTIALISVREGIIQLGSFDKRVVNLDVLSLTLSLVSSARVCN
ncbi:hypothetical protein TEA_012008 [Camellia sinensis var. sinensis]|uniref:Transcription factor MYC/MYB N-terminal domain-containing protein n=1 Tax=Camellia sinensis var. sinensis TaxID=542762 RepID=A0A4S4DV61_CAMSN|nr:hypothetical protein TEA_012008 [Camellia sinensis var. sinensis]